MEVKQYIPSYKKALVDISKDTLIKNKIINYKEYLDLLFNALQHPGKICLTVFGTKFKGYIIGIPKDKEVFFILHCEAKDGVGSILVKNLIVECKLQGYKYIEYIRSNKEKMILRKREI